MKYLIVHFLISSIFISIPTYFCLRFLLKRRPWFSRLFAIISVYAGMILLYYIPIENAFVTFKTREDVVSYHQIGSKHPEIVLEGKESEMLIFGDTTSISIIKTSNGYKLCSGSGRTFVGHWTTKNGDSFIVYKIFGTNDYYLLGDFFETDAKDDCGSEFKFFDLIIGDTYINKYGGACVNFTGDIRNYQFYVNGVYAKFSKSPLDYPPE